MIKDVRGADAKCSYLSYEGRSLHSLSENLPFKTIFLLLLLITKYLTPLNIFTDIQDVYIRNFL